MKKYFPYVSDKPSKKFYIVTNDNKKVYFGAAGYDDYTTHNDERRRLAYISRHRVKENWNDPDTAGFWAFRYLWLYPTKEEALKKITKDLKNNNII